jgi:hypothetical protein
MKNKIFAIVLSLLSIFFINLKLFSQSTKRVLFIGNSYTAGNNLPQMAYDVSLSAGDTLIFDSNTPGGMTFQGHSTNTTTIAKIQTGNWDFVVLQEQSQRPSFPDAQVQVEVFPYATILDSMINTHNPCAETMFFMTWGRKNGDASNCAVWPPVCTYEGMDSLLHLRYMMMAEMNDAVVSPVGAVWRYLRTHHPAIELYQSDESHPSVAGSYAAAVCFYTSIFRKDPTNITFNSSIAPSDALIIRDAVKTTVYDSLINWHIGSYDPVADFWHDVYGNAVQFYNLSENANQFHWSLDDGTFSYDESPFHIYTTNGNYVVLLTASHCDLQDIHSDTIMIVGTEVHETLPDVPVSVYPSPAGDEIFLMTNNKHKGSQFKISDYAGKVVLRGIISDHYTHINIQYLLPGVYILKIQKEHSDKNTLKFLKL